MAKPMVWTVEPRADGRWAVQRDGSNRADSLHDGKQTAVSRGVELGRRHRGQLRIKGHNGRIEDERIYGDDPRRFRG
jgi:hypothetical protein